MRYIPENWTQVFELRKIFGRDPERLEIDLGCGKGRFLLARANANPGTSFLGLDKLLLRIEKVARKTDKDGLENVRLVYVEAAYAVRYLLPRASVNVYYIFFPDPWPKNRHYERRLFSKSFIEDLSATLVPGGLVHVATDSVEYFKEIEGLFNDNPSFRKASPLIPADHERTEFEELFTGQGETIGRCSFSLSV